VEIQVSEPRTPAYYNWLFVAALVYLLLVGVGVIGAGFKWVSGGEQGAALIFSFASSPIIGVILGVLATALVQSSSTVTSVIVGLVAGGVPVAIAVPMIMGANMGTTVTNTIVSIGSINDRESFKRSFQAATVHDFFNFYSIVIFLPIEVAFHPLERAAGYLSARLSGGSGAAVDELNFLGALTKPLAKAVLQLCHALPEVAGIPLGGYLAIVAGVGLVIASVLLLGRLLRSVMLGRAKDFVQLAIGRNAFSGVASGMAVTVMVQSSSTTTSLIVPLAGAGVLTLKQVFPFTMGANIGTCITALLAATSVGGIHQDWALQIALVHLLYNLLAVTLFLAIPWLRELPLLSARWLGELTERNRAYAFVYLFAVFFLLPGLVLARQALWPGEETQPLPEAPAAPVDFKVE
jgi:sodium-dependent phosphate cotransporter